MTVKYLLRDPRVTADEVSWGFGPLGLAALDLG